MFLCNVYDKANIINISYHLKMVKQYLSSINCMINIEINQTQRPIYTDKLIFIFADNFFHITMSDRILEFE